MMHDESSAPEHAAIHTPPRWLWLPWPLVLCWGIAVFVFSAPPIRPATAPIIAVALLQMPVALMLWLTVIAPRASTRCAERRSAKTHDRHRHSCLG